MEDCLLTPTMKMSSSMPLTSLYHRRHFQDHLRNSNLRKCSRSESPLRALDLGELSWYSYTRSCTTSAPNVEVVEPTPTSRAVSNGNRIANCSRPIFVRSLFGAMAFRPLSALLSQLEDLTQGILSGSSLALQGLLLHPIHQWSKVYPASPMLLHPSQDRSAKREDCLAERAVGAIRQAAGPAGPRVPSQVVRRR